MPATNQSQNINLACEKFLQFYGPSQFQILRAPARINILGEHVDYVSYLPTASLPFGSHEHEMIMVFRPNKNGLIRGASTNESFEPFGFEAAPKDEFENLSWTDYLFDRPVPESHWSNYVKGPVFFAQHKFQLPSAQGFDFLVHSTIPPQGGSSSSSALVVLAGAAFRIANYISYSEITLAQDSAQAEWFIGTRGGALDHTTICLARRHHAIHLSFANQRTELLPLPSDNYRWVTFFSQAADKGREIMLEYNERAAVARLLIPAVLAATKNTAPALFDEWEKALDELRNNNERNIEIKRIFSQLLPETLSLAEVRNLSPQIFEQTDLAFPALVRERLESRLKIRARALHHLGEIGRVHEAVQVLQSSESESFKMHSIGKLLSESHASLRDLYEVSTPEVEKLIRIISADKHVFGARLIGGGFGGNILALIPVDNVGHLIDQVQNEYYEPQKRNGLTDGSIMISTPGEGIKQISHTEIQ